MNDTPTPRTNKAFLDGYTFCKEDMMPAVAFASQLERELTAARSEATHYEAVAQKATDNLIAVREELAIFKANNPKAHAAANRYREQRDAVTLRLGNTQERMFNAERQRDRLLEQQEQWRLSSVCRELIEQRDRLAEALKRIADNNVQDTPQTNYAYEFGRMEGISKIALQSLTPNEP